jgi:hypothetical protein
LLSNQVAMLRMSTRFKRPLADMFRRYSLEV